MSNESVGLPIAMYIIESETAITLLVILSSKPTTTKLPLITAFPATDKSVSVPTVVIAVCEALVTDAADPVTAPTIGVDTVNPVSVPTDVMAGCAAVVTVAADPVMFTVSAFENDAI